MTSSTVQSTIGRRKWLQGAGALAGVASLGMPALSFAQNKPIRVGMPTILSGRVAMLGLASSYAAKMEVEKFNAAGGLNGRKIELVVRDSKGQPQEAARIARELRAQLLLVPGSGIEFIPLRQPDQAPAGQQHHRVQIALQRLARLDPHGRVGQRRPPVHADHGRPGLVGAGQGVAVHPLGLRRR